MNKLLEMLQQDFMLRTLAGTGIVALLCSYLGVFIVLRRAVFVGAALSQVSSFGVALALFLCGCWGGAAHGELPWLAHPMALILTVGAALLFAAQPRERRLPRETIIGVAYAAAGALTILVVAVSAGAEAQVVNLLFGNVLTISDTGIVGLGVLALLIGGTHAAFFKEFLFVSFDPDMAQALGLRARWWNALLFLTIGLTVAFTIRVAGALVVFSFLVLPAATALLLRGTMRMTCVVAMLVGVLSSAGGIAVSYVADLPSGPAIVCVNAGLLALAGLWRAR
ncbi:MAG: metal ABC transporter permease [Verrucomicrobia bacterium]|nr:metal ABC transporter permease [Verrucomicrobiota bacterium]